MASIGRRIEDLERLFGEAPTPEDEAAELRRAVRRDIMDEFARLKACRATQHYRGGTPPVPIRPTDPAGEALGYPYTTGDLARFAARRVFERERDEAPDVLGEEEVEVLVAAWGEHFRRAFGERWEEVEAESPPGSAPGWRGGS